MVTEYEGPEAENTVPRASHEIKWHDDLMVGYTCSWDYNEVVETLSAEDGWRPCFRCQQNLRLHWVVYIQTEE